jgi:hypothetical protein
MKRWDGGQQFRCGLEGLEGYCAVTHGAICSRDLKGETGRDQLGNSSLDT